MSDAAFDLNAGASGKFAVFGASKSAFPEAWATERMFELAMHTKNVHAPEVVAEREQRERGKFYDQMKRELAARREAASGRDESLSA